MIEVVAANWLWIVKGAVLGWMHTRRGGCGMDAHHGDHDRAARPSNPPGPLLSHRVGIARADDGPVFFAAKEQDVHADKSVLTFQSNGRCTFRE